MKKSKRKCLVNGVLYPDGVSEEKPNELEAEYLKDHPQPFKFSEVVEAWKKKNREKVVEEEKKIGPPIRTSNSLLSNIGRSETILQPALDLFPEEEITLFTQETSYSPEEVSLIYALLPNLSDSIDNTPSLQEYIKKLGPNLEERESNGYKPLPNRVSVVYEITDLARLRYGIPKGKKVDNKQKKRLLSYDKMTGKRTGELAEMSLRSKTFTIKGNGRELALRAPLITIGKDVSLIDSGVVKKRAVEICFEDVFLYDILEKYALLPRNYPALRAQHSENTEVFRIIESHLLQWRGDRVKKYRDALEELQKRKKKESLSEEEYSSEEKKLLSRLEIELSEVSIVNSLSTSTYFKDTKKKKYLYRARLRKDIEKASEGLQKMGLLSRWRVGKTSSGGDKYIFTYSVDFV